VSRLVTNILSRKCGQVRLTEISQRRVSLQAHDVAIQLSLSGFSMNPMNCIYSQQGIETDVIRLNSDDVPYISMKIVNLYPSLYGETRSAYETGPFGMHPNK